MTEQNTASPTWADDYLNRKDDANYLSNYLRSRYEAKKGEPGFVLAINGDWGTGKTFMMDRWESDIKHSGHPTIKFNSWENDFTSEPLVAFIAEIDKSLKPFFQKVPAVKRLQKEWMTKARAVLIPTLKIAGLSALKIGVGIGVNQLSEIYSEHNNENDDLKDQIENQNTPTETGRDEKEQFDKDAIQEKLCSAIEEKLSEHNNTKDAIASFKEKFSAIIKQLEKEQNIELPIFVFIDELDRCRPDYAIKLLEGIKHLFGIPGLYFIISTNISELAHSVRAVYGSGFSSERYLKRFFDMEYSLPEASGDNFCEELMAPLAAIKTPPFITGFEQIMDVSTLPLKGLPFLFQPYEKAFELTLRDQHQAARILETAIISLKSTKIHIHFLIFLSCMYQKNSGVYRNVVNALNFSAQTRFSNIISQNGRGIFKYSFWYGRTQENKSVNCTEIAEIYFKFLRSENPSTSGLTTMDLLSNLQRALMADDIPISAIASYIEVVRRAGHFT
jgi:hypothetical protein